jgi:acetolactate synthase I/III small subunit
MRHVLSALVQNQPGVLAQVSGMLASRNFNIDSLAVGETEQKDMSRMTLVVKGDDNVIDQVRKQLEKIITVVHVEDISAQNFVERDLMLIKIQCPAEKRAELALLVETFRGRIVDIQTDNVILELARTGRIALVRGLSLTKDAE